MFSLVKSSNRTDNRGFTLIEIMIVLAIIGGILAVGVPRLFNSTTAMRSTIRKLAIVPREIRNIARLYNMTGRIVINMDDEKGHSFWVETAPGSVTLLSQEQEEELARMTSSQRDDEKPKSQFQAETRVMKKPVSLPRGLFFEGVEYAGKEKGVSGGKAYVHFFPQGRAEEVAIHLTDRKTLNWTVTIQPLTGRAEIYERKASLKELAQ
jgi:prepilin-type N-terminal cleavage/methylation domain-containing protein